MRLKLSLKISIVGEKFKMERNRVAVGCSLLWLDRRLKKACSASLLRVLRMEKVWVLLVEVRR